MRSEVWAPGQHITYDDGTYLGTIVEVRGVMLVYRPHDQPNPRRLPMVTMHEVRRIDPPA